MARGKIQFLISIPTDFTRKLIRNQHPEILVEADATDPVATGNALAAIDVAVQSAIKPTLTGGISYLQSSSNPIKVIIHAKYNPEEITQYNIVPGLLGVVLTMTMVMITSLAITRERERGTMENLLATPVQPLEVMLGKIIPYIIVGYIQFSLILFAAYFLFEVPIIGSLFLLVVITLPFIAANSRVKCNVLKKLMSKKQSKKLGSNSDINPTCDSGYDGSLCD